MARITFFKNRATSFHQTSAGLQERFLGETLCRFGITPFDLLDHGIKILVHINPKLDHGFAAIKLVAGSLV